jgi:hypothetical protein
MDKKPAEADGAPRAAAAPKLAVCLLLCLTLAGCAGAPYRPLPDGSPWPAHGGSDGGGSGGGM